MKKKRAIVIIIDGVGIGEMPDASKYGDEGSHTLANLANAVGGLHLPNLEKMGLGKIEIIQGLQTTVSANANFGKMAEMSKGKDSTTGHWELAGLIVDRPFPTYPNGFPTEVINKFKQKNNCDILGNKPASGTEIIKELGEEHIRTGKPIVYTSADSVFQIAAHEKIISLQKLYEMCEIAREILTGPHAVARVIARPFIGNNASDFSRTKYRRDFSLKPFGKILHQILQEYDIKTVAIGKINDLYALTGIEKSIYTKTNKEGREALWQAKSPYNVTTPAMTAALAALDELETLKANVSRIIADRERLGTELRKFPGLTVFPSETNFLLVRVDPDFGKSANEICDALKEQGILIRLFENMNCLRITIGKTEEMEQLLYHLSSLVK